MLSWTLDQNRKNSRGSFNTSCTWSTEDTTPILTLILYKNIYIYYLTISVPTGLIDPMNMNESLHFRCNSFSPAPPAASRSCRSSGGSRYRDGAAEGRQGQASGGPKPPRGTAEGVRRCGGKEAGQRNKNKWDPTPYVNPPRIIRKRKTKTMENGKNQSGIPTTAVVGSFGR